MELLSQLDFILQYDWVRYSMTAMVIFRLIFKPTFAILGKYVELTVEEDDDKRLKKFMKTKTYKMMAFIVELLASVKMPKVNNKGEKNGK
jgi:hypothetical protein